MKLSITAIKKFLIIVFWIGLWQIGSILVGSSILLASPFEVAGRIVQLIQTGAFWFTITNSFSKIMMGFILGMGTGILFAVICYRERLFYEVLSPVFILIRSIPVASFIVLLLVFINTRFLSTTVGCLIVLPVVFENVYSGLNMIEKNMLEMSEVFRVPFFKRLKYLYLPSLMPVLLTSVSVGVGFCFKSGVAAEVIGICRNTIGEAIYVSKINLETADVLAWTVIIILLSTLTEKSVRHMVSMVEKRHTINDRAS